MFWLDREFNSTLIEIIKKLSSRRVLQYDRFRLYHCKTYNKSQEGLVLSGKFLAHSLDLQGIPTCIKIFNLRSNTYGRLESLSPEITGSLVL